MKSPPRGARKWVDGSGAIEMIERQKALYLNLNDEPEAPYWRERDFQAAVIEYIDKCHPQVGSLVFHVPLELLRRTNHTAGMFHALGARAGVADIVMLVPKGVYHGLVLELKVPPRRPTDAQCTFLERARANKYLACWTNSFGTVFKLIQNYLALPPDARIGEIPKETEV